MSLLVVSVPALASFDRVGIDDSAAIALVRCRPGLARAVASKATLKLTLVELDPLS